MDALFSASTQRIFYECLGALELPSPKLGGYNDLTAHMNSRR